MYEPNLKPLYVNRPLLNGPDIIRYVKMHGVETTLDASDMHVTIVYSRKEVDISGVAPLQTGYVMQPAFDRVFHVFDPPGCMVLKFKSDHLTNRNFFYRNVHGCSYDFPEYLPHITITYEMPDQSVLDNLAKNPYCGILSFGPEIAKELDPDFKPQDKK